MDPNKSLVLVVDDDIDTLKLLKLALSRFGYDVLTASNWYEVNDRLAIALNDERPIAAVVLDLMMPEQSGFDILRTLQVMLVPMPPVVMLTAVVGTQTRIDARDLGVTRYLTKPTTPARLHEVLTEMITQARAGKFGELRDKFPPKSFTR